MNAEKLIGILEMEHASTQFYIRLLTESYSLKRPNNLQTFKLIPADFEAINNLLPYRSAKLDSIIDSYLKEVLSSEIECILIPNITIHETVDTVWDTMESTIPIAHPILGTIERMHQAKQSKAVFFGSSYTMTCDYIKTAFANADITIEEPRPKDLQFIDQVRKKVYSQTASEETLEQFNKLVQNYTNETTVLIGCTELSIASKFRNERILDMDMIQVEDAISVIKT